MSEDFKTMRTQLDAFQTDREQVILLSREIVKLSKVLIYSVQRKEEAKYKENVDALWEKYRQIQACVEHNTKLRSVGAYKMAVQEHVEAICYHDFVTTGKVPESSAFDTDPEFYLMGLCDLTGELVREAINEGIKGNYATTETIRQFVSDMYGNFLQFDFSGGELRKKFDSIKYDLNKLENLVYDLKLKGKL